MQTAEDAFEEVHGASEIERHQSADDTESEIGRNAVDGEGILQVELEDRVGAGDSEGESGRCHARHEQRQKAGHGQVYHQDFEHKDETGNRSLEDASHSTGSSAAHEQHHVLARKPAHLSETAAYGTARQHDRRLRTDTTAKADGNGGGYD